LRHLTVLVRGPFIDKSDLTISQKEPASVLNLMSLDGLMQMSLPAALKHLEKHLIQQALQAAQGNRTDAARRWASTANYSMPS
jgi:DNA-binding NtrC family response regulator